MNREQRRKLERFGIKAFSNLEYKKADFILEVDNKIILALTGPQDKIKTLLERKYPEVMKEVKRQTDYDVGGNATLSIKRKESGPFVSIEASIIKRTGPYLTGEDLAKMTSI